MKPKRTSDFPKHVDHQQKKQRLYDRVQGTVQKTWEDLTDAEKDQVMKSLAVRFGLVADSPDT